MRPIAYIIGDLYKLAGWTMYETSDWKLPRPTIWWICRAKMTKPLFLMSLLASKAIGSYPHLAPRLPDVLRAYAHYHRSTFPFRPWEYECHARTNWLCTAAICFWPREIGNGRVDALVEGYKRPNNSNSSEASNAESAPSKYCQRY